MNQFHYIYKTVNLINDHFYVGRHSSNLEPEKDRYLGSGLALNHAFKKHGRENFQKTVLEYCEEDNIKEREAFWIKELDAVNQGYNLTDKSCGGDLESEGYKNRFDLILTCPHCGFENYNKAMMVNVHFDNCKKNPFLDIEKMEEKERERKRKLRETRKNKPFRTCPWCNLTSNNDALLSHHFDNCKQNPDYVDKRELLVCPYCGKEGRGSGIRAYHFEKCKLAPGFVEGVAENRKTPEHVREILRKRNADPEFKARITARTKGVPKSEEWKQHMKESWLTRESVTCEHCGLTGKGSPMVRSHGDNCKLNPNYIPKIKETLTCEYCGYTSSSKTAIARCHGENCKQNPNRQVTLYSCEWCDMKSENKTNIIRFHNDNCKHNPNRKS